MNQRNEELIDLIDDTPTSKLPSKKVTTWAGLGALGVAVLASACCWLPLLLVGLGISGGVMSATFGAWRPVLLPITFMLLGAAFYFTYRKPRVNSPTVAGETGDSCCAVPASGAESAACCPPVKTGSFFMKKLNKVQLWVVSALVLAFTLFPNYIGYLYGSSIDEVTSGNYLNSYTVSIEGMTCEGCAAGVRSSLEKVPGVEGVAVSYEDGQAIVSSSSELEEGAIIKAVEESGFTVREITKTNQPNADIKEE